MNHFRNARIIGDNITHDVYALQVDASLNVIHRGDPRFIMSRGELVDFLECPMKWLASEGLDEKSKAMDFGSLVDMLALTPELFDKRYVVTPDQYTNAKGESKDWSYQSPTCREWRDEQEANGMSVVTPDELEKAKVAVTRLMADDQIREFIQCSRKQVMVVGEYHDHDTGLVIPVRALTDLVPDPKHVRFGKSLGDLKTAANAHPLAWPNAIRDHGYDAQAAINLDLHTAATPDVERIEFRHIIQESKPPFQTGRRIVSEQFIERGRSIYLAALKLYCKCLQHQFWPDFEVGDGVMNGWTITQPTPYMISSVIVEPQVIWPTLASAKFDCPKVGDNSDLIP